MFTFVIPRLYSEKDFSKNKEHLLKVLLNFLLVFSVYCGLFVYSLSDFFAFSLCTLSVFFERRFKYSEKLSKKVLCALGVGIFVYLSYNVRTIYLFSGIYIFFLFIIDLCKTDGRKLTKIIFFLVFAASFFLAAFPMLIANRRNLGRNSIAVPTESLMLAQVAWGIKYQRYDTYIGFRFGNDEQSDARMFFIDPVGEKLLQKESITSFASWKQFFKFCKKYPLEVAGIYVRHFVNLMFPVWPETYVKKIGNFKLFAVFLGIVPFFLFGVALAAGAVRNLPELMKTYAPLLISTLFILAGAVESRFFISVFMLVFGTLSFSTDWKKVWGDYVLEHKFACLGLFVILSGLVISQWGVMLMSQSAIPITFLGK